MRLLARWVLRWLAFVLFLVPAIVMLWLFDQLESAADWLEDDEEV